MNEKENMTVLLNRLESIKEQIKKLVDEEEALTSVCVTYKKLLQIKYQTLSNPEQLIQDYQDNEKHDLVVTYLIQYMRVFFPDSTSINIQNFIQLEPWYRIIADIDGEHVHLDVPTYAEEVSLDPDHFAYILGRDIWFKVAFDPAELIQHKEK